MTTPVERAFALSDHHGTPVTEQTYRGQWLLVFFGFTHCQVVCPRALSRLSVTPDGQYADHFPGALPAPDLAARLQAHLGRSGYLVTVRVAGAEADPANPRPPKKRAVRA
ncbi:MAG TPA: SCO family protein [Streptosporangiaceae bacterium]|nr:SCO family protein [Streptosporangiaceae bacterium]